MNNRHPYLLNTERTKHIMRKSTKTNEASLIKEQKRYFSQEKLDS